MNIRYPIYEGVYRILTFSPTNGTVPEEPLSQEELLRRRRKKKQKRKGFGL